MSALETQVGQIFINNKKLSKSFVSLFSEKIEETGAEVYAIVEIGALNPAAWAEYEKLFKNICAILRRSYRKPNPNAFENAIAHINTDLADMAQEGQAAWVGQLNACVAVRQNQELSVSVTGKIQAYLLRDGQFSDIAGAESAPNPLKTFENFAVGKVTKKDFIIFSTTQLFNYISVERLQKIIEDLPLNAACQTIAELTKDLADESVSFATLILELGGSEDFTKENIVKIMNITEQKPIGARAAQLFGSIKKFAAHTVLLTKQTRIPKVSLAGLKNIDAGLIKERARQYTDLKKLKELPRAKKFFLGAALVFLLLLIVNVAIAVHIHYAQKATQQITAKLNDIQNKIIAANTAYITNDLAHANSIIADAQNEFNGLPASRNSSLKNEMNSLGKQLVDLQNTVQHISKIEPTQLANYTGSTLDSMRLAGTTLYLFNGQGQLVVPYDLNGKIFQKDFTLTTGAFNGVIATNGLLLFKTLTGAIFQVDPLSQAATQEKIQVPADTAGFSIYGAPVKIYTVQSSTNRILDGALTATAPSSYLKQNVTMANAMDLAIDGSVYVLQPDGIHKFTAGVLKNFTPGNTSSGITFGAGSKMFTDKSTNDIYVLNTASDRLVVFDKSNGALLTQYSSDQFKGVKDFAVDSANKIIYVLSGQTIYEFHF